LTNCRIRFTIKGKDKDKTNGGNSTLKNYMTTKEAAIIWSVEPKTVSTWINRGKIQGAEKIGRDWLIPINTPKPIDKRIK
jgi:excisionase family DNA binding protein